MVRNSVLIVIDGQNDFHDISIATLAVPGACKDSQRIADFIKKVNPSKIFASLDTHYSLDIAHTAWFRDSKGNPVSPFTIIKPEDIENGKYVAVIDPKRTLEYLKALEANGEFQHMLWPDHCLEGSEGQALFPVFFDALKGWMNKNLRWVNFITKGVNPYTEHFGIFRANVPLPEDPSTQVNQGIFQVLNSYDVLFLAGQARTHCVANSLKQMLQIAPQLAPKIVVLEDCMSNVAGLPPDFYAYVDKIYADAKSQGISVVKSTDV